MTASRMAEPQSDTCNAYLAASLAGDRWHVPFTGMAASGLHGILPVGHCDTVPEHIDIIHEYIGSDPERAKQGTTQHSYGIPMHQCHALVIQRQC